jgi:quinol monooxygenase YgiN
MNIWKLQILKNLREVTCPRVIAILLTKNGLTDQLENILVNLIQSTRKEEGNIAYVLHRSIDNPNELMLGKIWVDKESLEAHLKQPYI